MTSFTLIFRVAAGLALAMAMQARAAEPARPAADPADPNAAVAPARYQSAVPYRPAPQQARTPDQDWKALNQAVGAIDSMSLTMKRPAAPQPAPDGQPAAPMQMQHDHHHEMKQ